MQWAARIYLAQGKIDSAINYLHFTFNYTARMTNVRYKRNIYEAAVAIYKEQECRTVPGFATIALKSIVTA